MSKSASGTKRGGRPPLGPGYQGRAPELRVPFPPATLAAVNEAAKAEGQSRAAFVRDAVTQRLDREQCLPPEWRVTDDDRRLLQADYQRAGIDLASEDLQLVAVIVTFLGPKERSA